MPKDSRLTEEQEVIRKRGLRILARMIVRAHMEDGLNSSAGEGEEGAKGTDSKTVRRSSKKQRQDD